LKQEKEKGIERVEIIHRQDIGSNLDERMTEEVRKVLIMPSDSSEEKMLYLPEAIQKDL